MLQRSPEAALEYPVFECIIIIIIIIINNNNNDDDFTNNAYFRVQTGWYRSCE